jgi:hypothetical protein
MRSTTRRPPAGPRAVLAAGIVALLVAGCVGAAPSAPPSNAPRPTEAAATPAATPATTTAPLPTPVPTPVGTASAVSPEPGSTAAATTGTPRDAILDAVPAGFPVYPGARPADGVDTRVSGAWVTGAAVDVVATWYRDALEGLGFGTAGLSSPLEDGSRVLDTVSDLPECRIQTTFRPDGGSTMILVLYGAGCAAAGG